MHIAQFLKVYGQPCTILRDPVAETHISQRKSASPGRNVVAADALYHGLVLADSGLRVGDLYRVDGDTFLVRSASHDPASGQIAFRAVKTNALVTVQEYTERVPDHDQTGNVERSWQDVSTGIPALVEGSTGSLRDALLGLRETSTIALWMQDTVAVQKLYRIRVNDEPYQVNAIDRVTVPGLLKALCSVDVRA